ncbi:hypothetical protein J3E71DRAFT_240182 [Bipolaris maydis]|nr:hypothetical protein J3E71DRAFT_240182 [Bipolaris maydis]
MAVAGPKGMVLGSPTTIEPIGTLVWDCLCLPVRMNGLFPRFLSTSEIVLERAYASSLAFCPDLLEVLNADLPPTIEWFKNLPTGNLLITKCWGVYALTLEKPDHKPRIYIGSGTQGTLGVRARWSQYDAHTPQLDYDKDLSSMPRFVLSSLEEGYTITYKGLLVAAPLPSAAVKPFRRLFLVALEAALACAFWAFKHDKLYSSFGSSCQWELDAFTYDGVCGHIPLIELVPGDFDLTDEDREALEATAKANKRAYDSAFYRRLRDEEPERLKAINKKANAKYYRNPHGKSKAKEQRRVDKAKSSKKHYCDVCELACVKVQDLEKHLKTPRHLKAVADRDAGIVKRFRCKPCNKNFPFASALAKHDRCERHKKLVAKLEAAALKAAA